MEDYQGKHVLLYHTDFKDNSIREGRPWRLLRYIPLTYRTYHSLIKEILPTLESVKKSRVKLLEFGTLGTTIG
jgi:hypothetical protein